MRAGLLIGAVIFICMQSCTYRSNEPNICFQEDILPIFASNCAQCHDKYATYNGILRDIVKHHPLRSEIYQQIKGSDPEMPPEGHKKLSSQQVYLIKTWISMGAQNTANCRTCDTSQYKFGADIQPILGAWCAGSCHTSSSPDGGFDLTIYSGVKNAAVSGKLMGSIQHASGYSAMPKGGGKLGDCEISKIQNWINLGYPNN